MAFQRPFLISLKRSDSHMKWGFSLKGGKDYGEPLLVQTVAEDSLAEKCGLRENDEVIQVGRVNVQDLSLGQVYELLARCGNKIEMFIVREDLLSPRKGKEPPVVKAVVHNPYNSPLSLYSTENIADTLAKQTEVLTEGHISTEEEDGPENLSFKQKSAVFQLLEEQSNKESAPYNRPVQQSSAVRKPKTAPPPPPKPKPPSSEHLYNGYDSPQQVYYDQQRSSNRVEYQTTQKTYQYQQEPTQYQQTAVYQSSYQSPGYQSPLRENVNSPGYQSSINYNQYSQSPKYEQSYQQQNHINSQQLREGNRSPVISNQQQSQTTYQQSQGSRSPVVSQTQQHPGYQSPTTVNYQQLNQSNYRQTTPTSQQKSQAYQQSQQVQFQQQTSRDQEYQRNQQSQYQEVNSHYRDQEQHIQQSQSQQQTSQNRSQESRQAPSQPQHHYIPQKVELPPSAVSKAEFKIGPPPPPRGTSVRQDTESMTAIYKQQYEQHLQKQYEQQQQHVLENHFDQEDSSKPKAHIIEGNIFEHNSSPGTPITYKTPPVPPPKPHWPPPASNNENFRTPQPLSPTAMKNMASVWPPKKSQVIELPRTGFNPAAVREQQGGGRRCVWPPPSDDEFRSGRNTPQSPITGRKIQWNPSPSPPLTRRTVFSSSQSPSRRKDIQWPPPSPTSGHQDKENLWRPSPRMSRKAKFDDYVHEHASINVPQTYRPPPGTQHVEFR